MNEDQEQNQFKPFRQLRIEPCYMNQENDSIEIKDPTLFSPDQKSLLQSSITERVGQRGQIEEINPLILEKYKSVKSDDEIIEVEGSGDNPDNLDANNQSKNAFSELNIQDKKSQKIGGFGFFKLMHTNRIIKQFIQNLMYSANILSKKTLPNMNLKKLLEEEYLKKKTKRKQQKKDMKIEKEPAFIRRSYTAQIQRIKNRTTNNERSEIKIPIFEPGNKLLLVWEVIKIQLILLIFWWGPFHLSFDTLQNIQVFDIQNLLSTFFSLDILIKLNKGYVNQGQLVKSRKTIFYNYVKQEALADMISLLCLGVLFYLQTYQGTVIFIFFIFNTSKINKGFKKIKETSYFQGDSVYILDLVQLILVIFFFAHVIACIWNYVGTRGEIDHKSWIIARQIQDDSPWTLYNQSFYWATMTMVTVGYGDITPTNDYEMIVANLTMFVACGVFAFSVNSIGIVLQNINDGHKKSKRTLNLINNYMNLNAVGFELQSRVRSYLEYCFQSERELNDDETHDIVSKLSTQLRQELLFQILSKVLINCKVISANFSEETQRKISCLMEPVKFHPEEKILVVQPFCQIFCSKIQQMMDQCLLYKKVKSYYLKSKVKSNLKCYNKGIHLVRQVFLLVDKDHVPFQVKASPEYLRQNEICFWRSLKIIKKNQYKFKFIQQKFHMIKDQMLFKNNFEDAFIKCYTCDKQNHMVNNCPSLRYIPDLERVIKQELYHCIQERSNTIQRKLKSEIEIKSMLDMKQIQNKCQLYREDNFSETDDEDNSERSGIRDYTYQGMVSIKNIPLEPLNSIRDVPKIILEEKYGEDSIVDTDLNEMNDGDGKALYTAQKMMEVFVKKNGGQVIIETKTPSFSANSMQMDSIQQNKQPSLPQRRGSILSIQNEDHKISPRDGKIHVRAQENKKFTLLVPNVTNQITEVSQSQDGGYAYQSLVFDSHSHRNIKQKNHRRSSAGIVKFTRNNSDQLKFLSLSSNLNSSNLNSKKGGHISPLIKQNELGQRTPMFDDRNVSFAHNEQSDHGSEIDANIRKYPSLISTQRRNSSKITPLNSSDKKLNSLQKKNTKLSQFERQDSDQQLDEEEFFMHDMDRMNAFQFYFPQNNAEAVCKKYARIQRNRLKYQPSQKDEKRMSKYTFQNEVITKVTRMKHYLKAQEKGIEVNTLRHQSHMQFSTRKFATGRVFISERRKIPLQKIT